VYPALDISRLVRDIDALYTELLQEKTSLRKNG
jgi:hypothetical protein